MYLLCLRKSTTDDEYVIIGGSYGKVTVDDADAKKGTMKDTPLSKEIQKLHSDLQEKFTYKCGTKQ